MSRQSDEWTTPRDLFDALHARYRFELDAAATAETKLCPFYWTAESDALQRDWAPYRRIFLNPPYSRCREFIAKAATEAAAHGLTVVCLVPARTDTRWFHEHIYQRPGVSVEFVKGRLKFGDSANSAPFPSMLVVFHGPQMQTVVA